MKIFNLFFLLLLCSSSFASNCYPEINSSLPQYIVGFGSLIDEGSKKRTDPSAEESIPALITGYKRSWSTHGDLPGLNATFLSVQENSGSSFNGVIYKLSKNDNIKLYDKRERVYCRQEVEDSKIRLFFNDLPREKQVWIYSSIKPNQYPDKDYPIVQSYVDVFIRGCLQIEEKFNINNFARDCIGSTEYWSTYWVNDRIFPRRPSFYEPYASTIDGLLKELLPNQFAKIKLESAVG